MLALARLSLRTKLLTAASAGALLVAAAAAPGAAQAQQTATSVPAAQQVAQAGPDLVQARTLVEEVAERGVAEIVAADLPQGEKIDRFRTLFATYFDIPAIGQFVLARNWRTASPQERERFLELFRELQIYTWSRRFGDYSGQQLVITGVAADGERGAVVSSRVDQTGGQPPISVDWRLRQREDGFRVVDLVVEGVSMAITYRSDYNAVLSGAGGSIPALLERMETQLDRLKAEQGQ